MLFSHIMKYYSSIVFFSNHLKIYFKNTLSQQVIYQNRWQGRFSPWATVHQTLAQSNEEDKCRNRLFQYNVIKARVLWEPEKSHLTQPNASKKVSQKQQPQSLVLKNVNMKTLTKGRKGSVCSKYRELIVVDKQQEILGKWYCSTIQHKLRRAI